MNVHVRQKLIEKRPAKKSIEASVDWRDEHNPKDSGSEKSHVWTLIKVTKQW